MSDVNHDVVETLLAPYMNGEIDIAGKGNALFVHGVASEGLSEFAKQVDVTVVQPFKPYADQLMAHGYGVISQLELVKETFDFIFVNVPKSQLEARYLMALSMRYLAKNGYIVCAANNKAGGTRLLKAVEGFGGTDLNQLYMNKCRCVWSCDFDQSDVYQAAIEDAILAGKDQVVCDGRYVSQSGIYGWDKIDVGSALLVAELPEKISARRIGDFGCGYGYLSASLLPRLKPPYKLYGVDADTRAVSAAMKNLSASDGTVELIWGDVVAGDDLPKNLDLIVMNPPFHEGKKSDVSIGQAFIARASQSLRDKGLLYMVANTHLPYEKELKRYFSVVEKLNQANGFKVVKAIK